MIVQSLCTQCKNFFYHDEFEVAECEMGRHQELTEAENNQWLTSCGYWEAK